MNVFDAVLNFAIVLSTSPVIVATVLLAVVYMFYHDLRDIINPFWRVERLMRLLEKRQKETRRIMDLSEKMLRELGVERIRTKQQDEQRQS